MSEMLVGIYVFVLASLAGREVITKVPPTLHTPLMSGANAISGISIVGALVVSAQVDSGLAQWLGGLSLVDSWSLTGCLKCLRNISPHSEEQIYDFIYGGGNFLPLLFRPLRHRPKEAAISCDS